MSASTIASTNDSISDRLNDELWERHEADKHRREVIRFRAEAQADDPQRLAALRAKGELNYAEMGVTFEGAPVDFDSAFDLMRDAVRNGDMPRARDIALRVHREIVDELAARPELLTAEVVR